MRELLQIDTPDWQLAVYGPDVAGKQRVLAKTMTSRGKCAPLGMVVFDRFLHVTTYTVEQTATSLNADVGALISPQALLFENTDYMFELLFKHHANTELPQITHKLASIQNSFRTKKIGNQLLVSGTLNFGNNVGWFSLPFSYHLNGMQHIVVKFVVLPTKMDLDSDLQAIYRRLDNDYPLWRFAFNNSTETAADAKRQSNNNFPLLWLARFISLRDKFEKSIHILLNAPHSRLVKVDRRVKAERLKGKLSVALQEKLHQDFSSQNYHNSYATRRKILSLDTPENRFIKMVLQYAHCQLGRFIHLVAEANKKPDAQIFSGSFVNQLNGWQITLEKHLRHPMFKEVGSFKGMSKESLVLQQKTGYCGVYQSWHELKRYLDVMGSQSSVSMKTIDELYEVWCFLEIRRILLSEELGFRQVEQKPYRVRYSGGEVKFDDVMADSYLFNREEDGLTIKLAHEPEFTEKSEPVRSWLYSHKPDIVLEATFADGFKLMWLFDAKYRIDNKSDNSEQDMVPADAIYQMHRYRDALIHIEQAGAQQHKSRSVYGAYALYPGANDQTQPPDSSKYAKAIESIGIGAFPLLPSASGDVGCIWLKTFLLQQFAAVTATQAPPTKDRYLLEDSARIPHHGMQQVHYPDLTMVVTAAPEQYRDQTYTDSFKQGTAVCYHTRLEATEREQLEKNAINEIRYCVIATNVHGRSDRVAKHIWPVKSVKLVKRSELNEQQTGRILSRNDPYYDSLYWFFEFGPAFTLPQPITGFDSAHHQLMLTTRRSLAHVSSFGEIEQVYREVMSYYP